MCRLIWDQYRHNDSRNCIESAERFADKVAGRAELRSSFNKAEKAAEEPDKTYLGIQLTASTTARLSLDCEHVINLAEYARDDSDEQDYFISFESGLPEVVSQPRKAFDELKEPTKVLSKQQADLVRDVFANPFRPVKFDSAWQSSSAVTLAQTMYDARDFAAMPILADALEDAGCGYPEVLVHCRGPGPHVRGCWVVDLVLGKA
jgi:hypothetical protein